MSTRPSNSATAASRYLGKGVEKAVEAVLTELAPAVIGLNADDQRLVDQALLDCDGTPDKSRLGANAILGVSLAVAKAAADAAGLPLFRYLGGPNAHILPVPMMNIVNGGAHADTGVDVQEFMVAPIGAPSFKEALRWGAEVYHSLKSVLKKQGLATGLGDEGGFAPDIAGTVAALDLISSAIEGAGFKLGADVALALDVAATEFYTDGTGYAFEKQTRTAAQMTEFYAGLLDAYPLVSIEDPLSEDDWDGWVSLTTAIGDRIQIAGPAHGTTAPSARHQAVPPSQDNAQTSSGRLPNPDFAHPALMTIRDCSPIRQSCSQPREWTHGKGGQSLPSGRLSLGMQSWSYERRRHGRRYQSRRVPQPCDSTFVSYLCECATPSSRQYRTSPGLELGSTV